MATLKSFMANKAAEREERNNSVPDGADHMVINLRSWGGSSDGSRGPRFFTPLFDHAYASLSNVSQYSPSFKTGDLQLEEIENIPEDILKIR